ncbi:unnamed protein product, partial [Polarella glacialis]
PGSIRFIEEGELWNRNATFIYLARVTTGFPQGDGCILSFRGSTNAANWVKDLQGWREMADFSGCPKCRVEAGFYSIWKRVEEKVLAHLSEVGCESAEANATSSSNNLYLTGHSMGSAVSNLAMFMLEKRGYKVQLSFNFESPRVGDAVYAESFKARFGRKIPV